jgi:hypothetical protein
VAEVHGHDDGAAFANAVGTQMSISDQDIKESVYQIFRQSEHACQSLREEAEEADDEVGGVAAKQDRMGYEGTRRPPL